MNFGYVASNFLRKYAENPYSAIVIEMTYLDGLNDRQKEAVLAIDGPVSVLAGAGSGKTRVLTTRIYHLILQGIAPESILAVTFTNKAAREMRERLSQRLETNGALPFVATFHGLGRELLQQYGTPIGVPRYFSIYDRDDTERAVKESLKALDVDPKEIPPRFIMSRISKAKNDGIEQQQFSEKHGRDSFRSRIVADVWKRYDETLKKEKALDFDDLLTLPVKLLEKHPDVRQIVHNRFSHVHIDEYQDTNSIQARLVDLIAGETKNVFVVGDIDQCLVPGTLVTMHDGTRRPIEDISEGDMVLSNYGSGVLRPALVEKVIKKNFSGDLVRLRMISGKVVTSTPEHVHFAGYKLGQTPQLYFTYLMKKKGVGWRVGVSQTYTKGQRKPMIGFQQRCNHEHADAVWIIGVYDSQQKARVDEYKTSLEYGIPTLPFVARKGTSSGGYVHDQEVISEIFSSFDTQTSALRLLEDRNLSDQYPHHHAQGTTGRRTLTVSLCGEKRSSGKPSHRIAMVGNDEEGKRAMLDEGFSIRAAKPGSSSWRFETVRTDMNEIQKLIDRIIDALPDTKVLHRARFGGSKENPNDSNSLPFMLASSIVPGMALFSEENGYDIVESVERIPVQDQEVYDLNVKGSHNFYANGVATHNCIYTWRGATIDNLLAFDKSYPGAQTIILEHNYRSTKTIVEAANNIIELNRNRKEKISITDNPDGERIIIHPENSAEGEGRYIARECRRLIQNGTAPEEIAVLFRTNFQSRILEEAFLASGVPYKLLGTRFFDRKEVKDALSWIRLSLDPSRESDRARAVQSPPRGIGKVTLGKMIAGRSEDYKPSERMKVAAFEALLLSLNQASETELPSVFVRLVIEKSGLQAALEKGSEDDQERLENVKELATLATRYDSLPGKEGISLFLTDAALASDQDELDRKQNTNGVTLMTVHAAKGLEFDTVFVTGLEEGLFPHEGANNSSGSADEKRDEEEERRLFYVAVTRAKKKLFLTYARIRRIYGTDFFSEPSSFLRDIDPSLTDYVEGFDEFEDIIEA